MSTRMVRGRDPGTGISREQIMGTMPQPPRSRAARAGKSASRSWVTVKMAQTISSGRMRFPSAMAWQSSATPSWMASTVFASTWVAPRIPRMKSRQVT
jgi:hypothetical protein